QDASQLFTPAARQSGQKISEIIKTMNDQNRITGWMANKTNRAFTSVIGPRWYFCPMVFTENAGRRRMTNG
ncbi:MAG: hypothetical protein HOH60_06900, partial [Opitutae bacterium]|nr:hypothetical protein [Opitutae bacterium]